MAVESRFVVIRQGVEVETFMDKKAADEYDKMLDMADNLSEMFAQAPVELSEEIREELSVYLAQNRENVLVALQAKKAKVQSSKTSVAKADTNKAAVVAPTNNSDVDDNAKKEPKAKVVSTKTVRKKSTVKDKAATV
jgi:dsDNA-binding SOS-regulon protein